MVNTQRFVRDLAWVINSPSLLQPGPQVVSTNAVFDPRSVDLEHFTEFMSQNTSHRVGRYFERLTSYWLRHVRQLEIVAESQQIAEDGRTVGEIDVLFIDELDQLTHWEMAVKFYLHLADGKWKESNLVGPNSADTFERKTERLFAHQLPLSERFYPETKIRQAFVKGCIFYHPHTKLASSLPEQLNSDHLRCTWIRCNELELLNEAETLRYRIMQKPYWLAPEVADPQDAELLKTLELCQELSNHFHERESPVLISQLVAEETRLTETDRIFVVSESWPNHRT